MKKERELLGSSEAVADSNLDSLNISRRGLFEKTGTLMAAGVAGLAIGTSITRNSIGPKEASAATTTHTVGDAGLGYAELANITDAEIATAKDLAYTNWYKKYCTFAVTSACMEVLRNKVGSPYTALPDFEYVTAWGHGGAIGWGTLCGTLTGAGMITGMAAGADKGEKILHKIITYYQATALPIYTPSAATVAVADANTSADLTTLSTTASAQTSTSASPLCHISVGKWMAAADVKFFGVDRMDRCAKLSADMVGLVLTNLKAMATGTFTDTAKSNASSAGSMAAAPYLMPAQNNCTDCHNSATTAIPTLPGL